jgi:hypothetical protein
MVTRRKQSLGALSCNAQKTILFFTILQAQMVDEVGSAMTYVTTEISFSCQTV